MLEKRKNTMTYSYIEYESPLSQHCELRPDFWTKWTRELTKDVKADRIHGGEADFSRIHGATLDTQALYDLLPKI